MEGFEFSFIFHGALKGSISTHTIFYREKQQIVFGVNTAVFGIIQQTLQYRRNGAIAQHLLEERICFDWIPRQFCREVFTVHMYNKGSGFRDVASFFVGAATGSQHYSTEYQDAGKEATGLHNWLFMGWYG